MVANHAYGLGRRAPGRRISNRVRIGLSLAVLALISTIATAGSYALFNATTTTAPSAFSTGSITVTNNQSGSVFLNLNGKNMIPGDTITGLVDISNTGSEDIATYTLDTTPVTTADNNNLYTGANGLTVQIWRCAQAWTGTGSSATCGAAGGAVAVTAGAIAVKQAGLNLMTGTGVFCAQNTVASERTQRGDTCDTNFDTTAFADHLKLQVALPTAADNTYAGLTTNLKFTFTGTQSTNNNNY